MRDQPPWSARNALSQWPVGLVVVTVVEPTQRVGRAWHGSPVAQKQSAESSSHQALPVGKRS